MTNQCLNEAIPCKCILPYGHEGLCKSADRAALKRVGQALLALARETELRTGIADTSIVSHYGIGWRELMEWTSDEPPAVTPAD
jgi:hypothetical protein